jgi:hypothetical protein
MVLADASLLRMLHLALAAFNSLSINPITASYAQFCLYVCDLQSCSWIAIKLL